MPNTVGECERRLQVTRDSVSAIQASMATGDIREGRCNRSDPWPIPASASAPPCSTPLLSYLGTAHDCSNSQEPSKNVLVPKWAKKTAKYHSGLICEADEDAGSVVRSLLCLWPYGNSLIVCCDSEFYQCHTQNRRRYERGPTFMLTKLRACHAVWCSVLKF